MQFERHRDALQLCGVLPGHVVALIGAGGKTSLMESLADATAASGHRVLVTTTTRIWPPHSLPLILADDPENAIPGLREHWVNRPVVALGRKIQDNGKLEGFPPTDICRLSSALQDVVVLCEADGSAGLSLKVHAPHEPVIPPSAGTVAVVAGLDAVGMPIGPASIHRWERLSEQEQDCGTVTVQLMTELLLRAGRHAPPHSRLVYVLNKADTSDRYRAGAHVATRLRQDDRTSSVLLAVHGRVISNIENCFSTGVYGDALPAGSEGADRA